MSHRWAILGAGGLGREVAACAGDSSLVGFVDDGLEVGTLVGEYAVVGSLADVVAGRAGEIDWIVAAIGDRRRVLELVEEFGQIEFRTLVAPGATILGDVSDVGCYVAPSVIVGPGTSVGPGCLLNWRATIAHDCTVAEAATVGPGAIVNGGVHVGSFSTVGAGAVVLQGLSVGEASVVGIGSAVVADVPDNTTVFGSPARRIGRADS